MAAFCKFNGGACERETTHASGLCSLHRKEVGQLDAVDLVLCSMFDDGVKLGRFGKKDSTGSIPQSEWAKAKNAALERHKAMLQKISVPAR